MREVARLEDWDTCDLTVSQNSEDESQQQQSRATAPPLLEEAIELQK